MSNTKHTLPLGAIRFAIAEILDCAGFKQMSKDVLAETDIERIRLYVRVALKNAPATDRAALTRNFQKLGLA